MSHIEKEIEFLTTIQKEISDAEYGEGLRFNLPFVCKKIAVRINTLKVMVKKASAFFHCFSCGTKLVEIGMGFCECPNCRKKFLPYINKEDNQCLELQKE